MEMQWEFVAQDLSRWAKGIEMSSLWWKNNLRDWVTDRRAQRCLSCFLSWESSKHFLSNHPKVIMGRSDQKPFSPPSRWHCRHNVRTRESCKQLLGSGDFRDEDGRKEREEGTRSVQGGGETPSSEMAVQSLTAEVCALLCSINRG